MQEGSGDVPGSPPLHQPVTVFAAVTLPPSSSSATNGMESATAPDSDDDSDATGPPEETPEHGTETTQEADETDRTREDGKCELQPETPERSALADQTEDEAAQDVDVLKPDNGCATPPPPPPAHDSEGSGYDGSSPHGEKQKPPAPAGASGKRPGVAGAKSRLLAFRSFSLDIKGKKSGDAAATPQEAEHREKGKARWKRLWK